MELTGKIIVLNETETVGASNFRKRLVVIETQEQYSKKLAIEFVQDKTDVLNNFKLNDIVSIAFNIKGNEYNGRYYVSLQGWKINKQGSQVPQNNQPQDEGKDLPWD